MKSEQGKDQKKTAGMEEQDKRFAGEVRRVEGEELEGWLTDLIREGTLELTRCPDRSETELYVPYMMNDALECYLVFSDCSVSGDLSHAMQAETWVELTEDEDRKGVIFHRPDGEVLTLWYSECRSCTCLYQYHRIGHFWRSGEEQWRQLVYQIGTIRDKYVYLGEEVCNADERELMQLVNFAPFRYYSPIDEDLDGRYADSLAGIDCMLALAEAAGDEEYARYTRFYRKAAGWYAKLTHRETVGFPFQWLTGIMITMLDYPEREPLYRYLCEKVRRASEGYAVRDYGPAKNAAIEALRQSADADLRARGFQGSYPFYRKGFASVLVTEEHPFTVLDYEDFEFTIHYMISQTGEETHDTWNMGFFDRRGYVGRIERFPAGE